MSIKRKFFAAAATLALVAGAGAVASLTAGTANAATPSCGPACIDIFSPLFGNHHHPAFVMDSFKQGTSVGTPIILFRESNSDPAEDFTLSFQGKTSDFFAAGLVSSAVALHYGCEAGVNFPSCNPKISTDDPAFEVQYAPFGAPSGLCVGVGFTAFNGERVTLQPCGVSAKTVWILDTLDGSFVSFLTGTFPVINGSDTNFSHPFVLTYPANGFPTDVPRPVLQTANLNGFSNGPFPILSTISLNQRWGANFGVIHS